MSLENHPNFHAVLFTTRLMTAFQESLRGEGKRVSLAGMDGHLRDMFVDFVGKVEDYVDTKAAAVKA